METDIPNKHELKEVYQERSEAHTTSLVPMESGEPDLEWAYGSLENLVRMVAFDYEEFVMLDAPGGLGKTYNIKHYLEELLGPMGREWDYQSGYTTPLELYKTLYQNQDKVLFLDDMSGITKNDKCVNMLKEATDTEGEENWVYWKSSKTPETKQGQELNEAFCFRGAIIMSFNDVPENRHFEALESRAAGSRAYKLDFSYEERIKIIKEVAKNDDMSPLSYPIRKDVIEWIESVTDPSVEVNIRTLVKALNMREAYEDGVIDNWEKTALEVFDLNYEKYLILQLWESDEYDSVEEQIEVFEKKTGRSRGHYYNLKGELKVSRGL